MYTMHSFTYIKNWALIYGLLDFSLLSFSYSDMHLKTKLKHNMEAQNLLSASWISLTAFVYLLKQFWNVTD